jgi:hypothetical protein
MYMRSINLFGGILVVVAGAALFQIKYKVEEKDKALDKVHAQYLEDQKAIRVLKAEWAFLNSPDYIQDVTLKYLDLRPTKSSQIIKSLDDIPFRPKSSPMVAGAFKRTAKKTVTANADKIGGQSNR